jgi:hypothetical protein
LASIKNSIGLRTVVVPPWNFQHHIIFRFLQLVNSPGAQTNFFSVSSFVHRSSLLIYYLLFIIYWWAFSGDSSPIGKYRVKPLLLQHCDDFRNRTGIHNFKLGVLVVFTMPEAVPAYTGPGGGGNPGHPQRQGMISYMRPFTGGEIDAYPGEQDAGQAD